ncbi:MAG: MFS transporter [Roseiflexus castenholzii]|uniref:MFS transporter n=1 Tax=Roseiflexus castenholzii TaxID=120962 RepID=UPI000CC11E76|nr:MAG: MFS transporter [Roseiflexus castenholzii]
MDERKRNQILLVLFIGVLMAALDIAIVGPALPALREHFQIDARAASWMFVIYVLLNLVGTPFIAKLSDRFGRRILYTASIALFGLGSLIVVAAPVYAVVLAGRAIQGLGAGGIFPVASAVIGDAFPPEKRGSALGLIGAVFGIAFLVGPIIGGLLLLLGWQWLFLINLPIAVALIGFGVKLLPAIRTATPRPFDWGGTVVSGVLLAALAVALSDLAYLLEDASVAGLVNALRTSTVAPLLLLALAMAPVFWWIERRAEDPVLDLNLFRNRQIALAGALSFGAGLSEAVTLFVPSLLVAAFGVTPSTASFMLIPMVLAMAIGSPLSGRALDRVGSKIVVLTGTALIAAGLVLEGTLANVLLAFYGFSALFGIGIGVLLGASLRYILLNEALAEERGATQGVLTVFISIGQLIGAVLLGAIAAARDGDVGGYAFAFLVVGVLMVVLFIASFGLKNRAQELATQQRLQRGASMA